MHRAFQHKRMLLHHSQQHQNTLYVHAPTPLLPPSSLSQFCIYTTQKSSSFPLLNLSRATASLFIQKITLLHTIDFHILPPSCPVAATILLALGGVEPATGAGVVAGFARFETAGRRGIGERENRGCAEGCEKDKGEGELHSGDTS